jgi:hypothetical protein
MKRFGGVSMDGSDPTNVGRSDQLLLAKLKTDNKIRDTSAYR